MHDTFLIQNLTKEIDRLCYENGIKKVHFIEIALNNNSHIKANDIKEHIIELNKELMDKSTEISIVYEEDIEDLTAEIKIIEGEKK